MAYSPQRGDFVWLAFQPQAGHEQAGRRPALVLSPRSYNARAGLALACPVTRQVKGYPFEVVVAGGAPVEGAVLADQVRSVDWRAREAQLIGRASATVLAEVLAKLQVLLDASA